MTTPFENFVNIALGKSVSADVTLPTADDIPVFTGIGRQVTGKTIAELGLATSSQLTNKADLDSPAFTGTPTAPTPQTEPSLDNSTKLATTEFVNVVANAAVATANAYADGLVVNLWDDRGTFDPSAGSWPTDANNGSGVSGAIQAGDVWTSSGAGTLTGGVTVEVGDIIRALVDNAGNTSTAWAVTQNNIGYTAENSTNKSTDNTLGGVAPSDIAYPSQKAVKDYSDNKFAKIADQRYQFVGDVGTTYTVPASAVTANGNTIIELSSSSLTSITVDTNTAIGKTAGDSVYVSITGVYASQILVANGVTLGGDLTFSYQHQTKCLIFKGSNSWKVVG